jgi:hypothetical protein
MNSQILQQGTNHKHLGLFFSNNGLWHDHIDYIVKKAYTRLSMLRKVRFKLNRFTLEKMYFSFIRPILEYGDVVWDMQIHYLINKIENVQSEAARIVKGGTKLTSIQKLYEETGWEKLLERMEKHQLILLYKIVNNQAPGYLRNVLPDRVDNRHNHNTRQSANILEISLKTKFYSDYFLPSSIQLWNRLSIDTRNSRSLNVFKERIKTQNSKCPAHYYSGTRLGRILYTRLRMNSSSLNEHLFIRNLVDSPNCACGQVESTFHFLISCNKYTDLRNELMYTINYPVTIDIKLLPKGSDT